ncbi:MAG: hypothetical protein KAR05_09785 [Candidatus Omnitrophica bacterium]|nr:hypothetical protein [Candidatus Omnitrophota bacterium]
MAKFELFRRDSGEVLSFIVLVFIVLSFYVFELSYNLIIMGVKGEFEILAEFSGITLYLFSISPGISLAIIMAFIWIVGVPRILHPFNFGNKKK